MRAVDTNVLVRLLARDDERQVSLAEAFVHGGAWISQLVLVEATWVLAAVYERSPRQIAAAVAMLLDHRDLVVQDGDVVARALRLFEKRPQLGFSDCLILEVASQAGHRPLGTFDRRLGKLEGAQRLGSPR